MLLVWTVLKRLFFWRACIAETRFKVQVAAPPIQSTLAIFIQLMRAHKSRRGTALIFVENETPKSCYGLSCEKTKIQGKSSISSIPAHPHEFPCIVLSCETCTSNPLSVRRPNTDSRESKSRGALVDGLFDFALLSIRIRWSIIGQALKKTSFQWRLQISCKGMVKQWSRTCNTDKQIL